MLAVPKLAFHYSSLEKEGWEFDRCLAWAGRLDLHFIEVGPELPRECRNAAAVRRLVDRHGIAFAAVEVGAESCAPLPGSICPDLEGTLRWAAEAGCAQILLAGLGLDNSDRVYPQIAAAGERWGIVISIDLWGALLCRAEELRQILEKIGSPWMRVSIDSGRVLSAGEDPLALVAAFERCLGHFRIRAGPQDSVGWPVMRSMVELLLDSGYEGRLGILDESGRAQALEARVEEIRQTLALAISKSMPARTLE
ncbi:MAG: hypothetical protein ABSC05_04240 [Candidatus Solibacter sp.]|jgi:sugar phosphate isomerase/epimerase